MSDQPSQAALQEAVRRLNEETGHLYSVASSTPAIKMVARLIEKHEPETLVDPVEEARKVKAREILAEIEPNIADRVLLGDWDNSINMKIALAALSFADWRPTHD